MLARPTCECIGYATCGGGGAGANCSYDDEGDGAGTFTVECINP
jgi:hypothetical protein